MNLPGVVLARLPPGRTIAQVSVTTARRRGTGFRYLLSPGAAPASSNRSNIMRVEKIKEYALAVRRFVEFKPGDRSLVRKKLCELILQLEDEMTLDERMAAIEMSNDAPKNRKPN